MNAEPCGWYGGQAAALRAHRRDLVEQPVLRLGRQVGEQALGAPGGGPCFVEAVGAQRCRPVVTQVDGDGPVLCGRLGAEPRQCARLEVDHRLLVDLEHDGARRPGQPVRARIQAGRQDHGLANASFRRLKEKVVEEPGAHGEQVDHLRRVEAGFVRLGQRDVAVEDLLEELDPDRTHQRLRERVVDQRLRCPAGHRPGGGHHRRGGSHAGCQIPGVVVRPCHNRLPYDALLS